MVPGSWSDLISTNPSILDILRPRGGCDALSADVRLNELIPLKPKAELVQPKQVIDFSVVRAKGSRIKLDDLGEVDEKLTKGVVEHMKRSIDKMLKNSLYGRMNNAPRFMPVMENPRYTAEILKVETGDVQWRVKIRCSNWNAIASLYPSESHACEDYANKVVKPWVDANAAHHKIHLNYAVFAFDDETDATLCYMRFK